MFNGEGYAAKLCIVVLPYLAAALVGISRVDDYWHHWTDVFAGALIGVFRKLNNIVPATFFLSKCFLDQLLYLYYG